MNALYNSLQQDKVRLARLLECPLTEGRIGIQTIFDETCAAIAQIERGEHWTCDRREAEHQDWLDEQATRESVRPL